MPLKELSGSHPQGLSCQIGLHPAASLILGDLPCLALDRPPSFWSDELSLALGRKGLGGAGVAQPCGLKPAKRRRRQGQGTG